MNRGTLVNVAHIESHCHIYGPGTRFVIWVQGCSLACKGCWNKQMWSFAENQLLDREELLDTIINTKGIQGVTILGGEPLQQPTNIIWLLNAIRETTSLNFILYTGYTQAELRQMQHHESILHLCDIIISGRYEEKKRDVYSQWKGSSNQEVVYTPNSRIAVQLRAQNEVEIIINNDGSLTVLGYPISDFETSLLHRT